VETYNRDPRPDGGPERAIVALLTKDGSRAWGTLADSDALEAWKRTRDADDGPGSTRRRTELR